MAQGRCDRGRGLAAAAGRRGLPSGTRDIRSTHVGSVPAVGSRNDICGLRLGEGCHVAIMPGSRLGHEEEIAPEVRDSPAVETGRLMFMSARRIETGPGNGHGTRW